jgi:hypothetical protein
VERAESAFEIEKEKLENLANLVEGANNELAAVQEEIDSTPLPEGAQPKSRIQKRDELLLVILYI